MYKLWPSPIVFVAAVFLFVKGCTMQEDGKRYLEDHPVQMIGNLLAGGRGVGIPTEDITRARQDIDTGHVMQIIGGVLGAIGAALLGVGLFHQKAQTHALANRLTVSYEWVSVMPAAGIAPDPGLLTEDDAVGQLQARYPTLAKTAADTLRQAFAAKRRSEPTKLWYVKDLQVREAAV